MKIIHSTNFVKIPKDVQLEVKARHIKVTGKRGTLERSFRHVQLEFTLESPEKLRVQCWFGTKKGLAQIRTVCSTIQNMIKGVKYGFRYAMKSVYAHFPINLTFTGDKVVQVRNFLGEKVVRDVEMLQGCTVRASGEKDEIYIEGNDLEKVSQSAALVHQAALVNNKDIRKFLDGVYVSNRGTVERIKD